MAEVIAAPAAEPVVAPVVPATPAAVVPASVDPAAPAKPAAEATKAADPAESVVPAKYEYKLPEGLDPAMAAKVDEVFSPVARDLKLDNTQAQRLLDLYTTQQAAWVAGQADAWAENVKTWRDQLKADPEIGGAKLPQTIADAQRVIKLANDPEFTKLVEAFNLGDNPAFMRAMAKYGRLTREDAVVMATPGAQSTKSLDEKMYPAGGGGAPRT